MSVKRKFFVGGNWKMNGCTSSIDGLVATLNEGQKDPDVGKQRTCTMAPAQFPHPSDYVDFLKPVLIAFIVCRPLFI